jgi:hypothetical protein
LSNLFERIVVEDEFDTLRGGHFFFGVVGGNARSAAASFSSSVLSYNRLSFVFAHSR